MFGAGKCAMTTGRTMNLQNETLAELGWNNHFIAQLDDDEWENRDPARVIAVHRNALHVVGAGFSATISPFRDEDNHAATVGDWLLLDTDHTRAMRLLERKSLFKRRAAGVGREVQLIAANVDTLFIVSSCNQDFNIARLERYLALAREAEVMPVIILTKADLTDDSSSYVQQAASIMPGLFVEALDARNPQAAAHLKPWCKKGQTVAILGSSGVGKSTLVNSLLAQDIMATAAIREDDDKGRHTTTHRQMQRLEAGGWLIDTPGMRELQLTDVAQGIDDVFADVVQLAEQCKFSDCEHESEPGCAVQSAIQAGGLQEGRLARYRKLQRENRFNTESLAERRDRQREFGKMIKRTIASKPIKKDF